MTYKTWFCQIGEHHNCIGGLCFCDCHDLAKGCKQEKKELEKENKS